MRRARKNNGTSSGAMADVAFLLLIFFMVVTTFNKDYQLDMTLPPYTEESRPGQVEKARLIKISINGTNELMIQDNAEVTDASLSLYTELHRIISNKKKPILLIKLHPDADYQSYIELLAQLNKAKNDLRQTLAADHFKTSYQELKPKDKKGIEQQLKFKISEQEIKLI